jgi:hypothetical protein
MEQVLDELLDVDFGGQTQIVNQQEQNREVNPGGITQTDSEKTLYGPVEENVETTEKPVATSSEDDEEKTETELPVKKQLETLA